MKTYQLIKWTRKPVFWDALLVTSTEALAEVERAGLPMFEATANPMEGWGPWGISELPQFFIAVRPNGERFLVNTEGYDYARYIAKLPGKACPECFRTEERVETFLRPIELNEQNRCAACQCGRDEAGA